jgi:LacI family transcriptional regulator
MKSTRTTLVDIANALGVSIGTVHRALHNHPGINQETKTRVLQEARKLGYRANRAARSLSLKRKLRISVNTLKGTTSFWDEVRAGIEQEAKSLGMESVEIQYRTFPRLGDGDEAAFEAALKDDVNGIITFPSSPGSLRTWLRRSPAQIPIVCVATDAPGTGRLTVVSIDTTRSRTTTSRPKHTSSAANCSTLVPILRESMSQQRRPSRF